MTHDHIEAARAYNRAAVLLGEGRMDLEEAQRDLVEAQERFWHATARVTALTLDEVAAWAKLQKTYEETHPSKKTE